MFFWGLLRTFDTFYPSLYPIDLRTSAATQQVPVFAHGRYDYNAPLSLVEDYYAALRARQAAHDLRALRAQPLADRERPVRPEGPRGVRAGVRSLAGRCARSG